MRNDGHVGLSNEKIKEAKCGDFRLALSYLKQSADRGYFVIHVYSNTFDYSRYLQRSNVRGREPKRNFLERLDFSYYNPCNILEGPCYYKVIEEIPIETYNEDLKGQYRREQLAERRFEQLAGRVDELFQKMFEVDRILLEAGFELPWKNEELSPMIHQPEEKLYEKGQVYDFYKDIREITYSATNEIFLVDAYVDEEALDLYLEKAPQNVRIRILTNKPKGNFFVVAKKFRAKPKVQFEVRQNDDCHDRLFFVDRGCWVVGQSIKDAGRKPTYLVRIESYDLFKNTFERLWDGSRILV